MGDAAASAEPTIEDVYARRHRAANDLEQCAAFAQLLAVSLRNGSDLSDRELARIVMLFKSTGTRALQEIVAAEQIRAAFLARHSEEIEAAGSTRH